MKKLIAIILVMVLAISMLAACGGGGSSSSSSSSNSSSSSSSSSNSSSSNTPSDGSRTAATSNDGGSGGAPGNSGGVLDVIWAKNFGGSDTEFFRSMASSGDGYVVVGWTNSKSIGTGDWDSLTGNGDDDATIVKFDTNGDVVWKKNFGGDLADRFTSVIWDGDAYVAVGKSYHFGTGDWDAVPSGGEGPIIVKFDVDGAVVWKKHFSKTGGEFNSVLWDGDGYVAVGMMHTNILGTGDFEELKGNGGGEAFIVKFDTSGDVVWMNNFGGKEGDYLNSVTLADDGYVAVGYSYGGSFDSGEWVGITGKGKYDATIVKFDMNGRVQWRNNFGGSDHDYFNSVTSSGDGYVVVGYSFNESFDNGDLAGIPGKGSYDSLVVKYDTNGDVVWKRTFGGSGQDYLFKVIPDGDGYVTCGYSYGGSFDNGDWTGVICKGGYSDAIIVKFDQSGDVEWQMNFGGDHYEYFYSIIPDNDGFVVSGEVSSESLGTGDWFGTIDNGHDDGLIVKFARP